MVALAAPLSRSERASGWREPPSTRGFIYQANWLTFTIGGKLKMYSHYREYDPETGIFTSRDFLPYWNKYRAWSNNPVGQVDRDGLAPTDAAFTTDAAVQNAFLADVTDPHTGEITRKWVANYQGDFYPLNNDGSWRGKAFPAELIQVVNTQKVIREIATAQITEEWTITGTETPVTSDPGLLQKLSDVASNAAAAGRDFVEGLIPDVVNEVIAELGRKPIESTNPIDIANELKRRNEVIPELAGKLFSEVGTQLENAYVKAAAGNPYIVAAAAVAKVIEYLKSKGFECIAKEVTIELTAGLRQFRIRADLIATKTINGKVTLFNIEVKGNRGRLTPNQKEGFPVLAQSGGSPVGGKAEEAGLAEPGQKGLLDKTITLLIRVKVEGSSASIIQVKVFK